MQQKSFGIRIPHVNKRAGRLPELALKGVGFRVWGLGFRVWGLGFRV